MVKMEILKFVVFEIDKKDIIKAIDSKGNWLHLNWCKLPYYDKIGCPNCDSCKSDYIFYDKIAEPYIVVGAKCDYKKYLDKMREIHSDWSERKLRIPYLWQKNIDKRLRWKVESVISDYERKGIYGLTYLTRPEQYGMFVIATMLRLGFEIELKPVNIVWKIYLVGLSLEAIRQKKIGEYFK